MSENHLAPDPSDPVSASRRSKALYAEQVKLLYDNSKIGLVATVVNSAILVFILRRVIEHWILIAWLALMMAISLVRYGGISRFRRKAPDSSEALLWGRRFIVGLALSGVGWGCAGIFLFPGESVAHQAFLTLVIGGMVAGTAAAFSAILNAFFAFSVPALTPILIQLFLLADDLHLAIAGMGLLFWLMMVLVALRVNSVAATSFQLRFKNTDLVSYLISEKESSEKLNKKLIAEITDHKITEEKLKESERQVRHLSFQLLAAQEQDRRRISRELHDGLGGTLTGIKFKIEDVIQRLEQGIGDADLLKPLIPTIQKAVVETRRIMADLRPSVLDDLGVIAALHSHCREFQDMYPSIHINEEIDLLEEDISISLKTTIFRIVQEALNNVAKHSQADDVTISLGKIEGRIGLTVRDNGQGFRLEEPPVDGSDRKGLGLSGIRERAELSRGSFVIQSAIGKGTTLHVSWPMENDT